MHAIKPIDKILPRLKRVRQRGDGWDAECSGHEDNKNSLCINEKSDGTVLVKCQAGCDTKNVLGEIGLEMKDLFPSSGNRNGLGRIVAVYDYVDESGLLLYQAVRFEPKDFRQRTPNPSGGFEWNLNGVRRVPYRLPELLNADSSHLVLIPEGEQDVDRLRSLGFVATCNVGGAGQWREEYGEHLRGRPVAILADNDDAGRRRILQVARSLHGKASSIKLIEFGGLPEKGDVSDWLDAGHTPEQLKQIIIAAAEWNQITDDDRAEIIVTPDEHLVNDAAVAALAKDQSIFKRAGELVHVVRDDFTIEGIERPEGSPRITAVPIAVTREKLTSVIRFMETKSKKNSADIFVQQHPPDWCVKNVQARGQWPPIRPLAGIVEFPILRPDGTILDTPGYDRATGYIYEPSTTIPMISASPTLKDAKMALARLLGIVTDFPFARPAHRSAWVASVLTPVSRLAFAGPSPFFLVDSNVRGSGKGLLLDTTAIIVICRRMSIMVAPKREEEFRKLITSLVLLGDPLVLIDNIEATFGGASIDAALTGTVWKDRLLGGNEIVEMPLRATWYGTGNNVVLRADTSRRVCHIRLSCPDELPEERTGFKHPDLRGYVTSNRSELLAAVLTILRAWFVAGKPDMGLKPWGSFEGWSSVVRNAVVWLGLPDPGDTREELRSRSDRDANALRALINGWQEIDPHGAGMTAARALKILEDSPNEYDTLREAVLELCDVKSNAKLPSSRSLGNKLRRLQGRNIGGQAIDGKRDNKGITRWFVTDLSTGSTDSTGSTPHSPYAGAHTRTHARGPTEDHVEPVDPTDPR